MKKDSAKQPYDLNLIAVDDEALVLWAREAGWNPAEQELFLRYWKEAKRRIDRQELKDKLRVLLKDWREWGSDCMS